MTALESPKYQDAQDRIKGNPVIAMMAAGVATVPLAELAHEDGTLRSGFMNQANRTFDAVPGAMVEMLPGLGHTAILEDPRQPPAPCWPAPAWRSCPAASGCRR
jgi:hypothetical protein